VVTGTLTEYVRASTPAVRLFRRYSPAAANMVLFWPVRSSTKSCAIPGELPRASSTITTFSTESTLAWR